MSSQNISNCFNDLRIGEGYDIHALVTNRPLILGGIHIPYEKGLLGHSDGDALIHAIIDSLLGASGLGDIGTLFPDTSGEFKNANSVNLLKQVLALLKNYNYNIVNIDATIIAEKPKLMPHIADIKHNLISIINTNNINIKAKTNEGFGYLGKSEAIAVNCVCLIYKNHE